LGITNAPNPLCIVAEFMDLGSLHSYLKKAGPVPEDKLFSIVLGIAAGIVIFLKLKIFKLILFFKLKILKNL
jgi:serine/threonine protein kinase